MMMRSRRARIPDISPSIPADSDRESDYYWKQTESCGIIDVIIASSVLK
jgi:hypothetical protein